MILGYEAVVGFDWRVTTDADTGLRPLELYLLERTPGGKHIGTFSRLEQNKPISFVFYDLSDHASTEVESDQQLQDLAPNKPVRGTVKFRQYELDEDCPDDSPLAATQIIFGSDQTAHLGYSGLETSVAFARGLYHTWRLEGAPSDLEHPGQFGISIELEVERQGEKGVEMRSFFVDPEIIVEGNG